ncbi:hypothetical protein F0267_00930 [Vibrio coralliilyticus]|uniref:Uncharacterized protein n=4 Tax=Vibrio TaxID=662 RepID=A0AAN0W0H1_9VIBR|nr:hypothetical protein [Vibrio coralliilyticus]KIF53174.1 hypothetical protein H735_09570 [Vibrio owensii CAIM 1854 = LMG 25443]POB47039.1 hypothetical protein CRN52_13255 [Vibrio vulnificus]CAH1589635.1 conserved hypothetical protein [Vibrio jasicida]AIW22685.1 hypothetical protein IX92_26895 [Vibrio coralliilyticus]NOH36785.1 hypothetical protein [Vibrio coralliilyticus]
MSYFWWFLCLYTAASVVFAVSQLGYKGNDYRWWTWVIGAPALVIAATFGMIVFLIDYFGKAIRRLSIG